MDHLLTSLSHYQHLDLLAFPSNDWFLQNITRRRWADHLSTTLPCWDDPKTIQTRVSESSCSVLTLCIHHLNLHRYSDRSRNESLIPKTLPDGSILTLLGSSPKCEWTFHLRQLIMMLLYGFTAWPRPYYGPRLTTKHGCFFSSEFSNQLPTHRINADGWLYSRTFLVDDLSLVELPTHDIKVSSTLPSPSRPLPCDFCMMLFNTTVFVFSLPKMPATAHFSGNPFWFSLSFVLISWTFIDRLLYRLPV